MKRSACVTLTICILLFLSGLPSWAQMPQPFSADYSTTPANGAEKVVGKMYFSMPKMRMDSNARGQSVATIIDTTAHVMYMIMPAQHMYMEIDTNQASPMMARAPKAPTAFDPNHPCAADATCKKVGVETVNGRVCDKWVTTSKVGTSTAWIDQKLFFPIKTIGAAGETFELTNLKEGKPDGSVFEVPAGYRKMVLPAMGGGRLPQ
jgi:hypothetical protein